MRDNSQDHCKNLFEEGAHLRTQTERAMTAKMRRTQAPPKTPARMKIWCMGSVSTTLNVFFSWRIFNYFKWGVTMEKTQQRPPDPEKVSSGTVPGQAHQQSWQGGGIKFADFWPKFCWRP